MYHPAGASAQVGCVGCGVLGQAVHMAREIPEVVRAVAGLAATVLDEARKLPETLPGLPVRMIGLAMQKAMWLQQQYSGLVARGDELFTGIRGEDEPGLATFDDDEEELPEQPDNGGGYRESAFDRAADLTDEALAGLPEDPAADATVTAVEDVAESFEAEQVLDELAIEQLVDDETVGLPADPSPAEVVAAVEDITDQVAQAVTEEVAADVTGDTVTEDADALESALLESDAGQDADGLAEPAVLDASPEPVEVAADVAEPATEVDVLTPDGAGVTTAEATVTDEGVAAVEAPQEAGEPQESGTEVTGDLDTGAADAGTADAATSDAATADGAGPAQAAPVATDEGGGEIAAAVGEPTDAAQDTGPDAAEEPSGAGAAATTAPIEGYDAWSIAQLRGRLRG